MRAHCFLLGLAAFSALAGTAGAAGGSRNVAFVLDCSRSMEEPYAQAGSLPVSGRRTVTRLDAARHVLGTTLDNLGASGSSRVSVWFFGHRLAWEAGTDRPNLMEQNDYLSQTQGFPSLADLMPADDVEAARALAPFAAADAAALQLRLRTLKPWGEDPLYLALDRALDNFDRRVPARSAKIVVLTDGGNRQVTSSRSRVALSEVLQLLSSKPVEVHFIMLNPEVDPLAERELREIAARSWGSYRSAHTTADLAQAMDDVLHDQPPAEENRPSLRVVTGRPATDPPADGTRPAATIPASGRPAERIPEAQPAPPPPRPQTIRGTVIFYKQPVQRAKVTLEGTTLTATTDAAGRFTFANVPAGTFVVKVQATVKNRIRTAIKEVVVDPLGSQPLQVEMELPLN
jgi:hypothetical protein